MKLVLVEWIDSNSEAGWQMAKDALRSAEENELRCETVGYVAAENERYILVAASRTVGRNERDQLGDVMQIPKGAIVAVRSLAAGARRR